MARDIVDAMNELINRKTRVKSETRGVVASVTPTSAMVKIRGSGKAQPCKVPASLSVNAGDQVELTSNNTSSEIHWVVSNVISKAKFSSTGSRGGQSYAELYPPANVRIEEVVAGAVTVVWDSPVDMRLVFEVETGDGEDTGTKVLQTSGSYAIIDTSSEINVRVRSIASDGQASPYSPWVTGSPPAFPSAPVQQAMMSFEGILAAVDYPLRLYNLTGSTRTMSKVFLAVSTVPTGSAIIVDIKKNGTSIFPTSPKPQINASANTGFVTALDTTDWDDGDYLTAEITQIGSTIAGANLTVHIVYI